MFVSGKALQQSVMFEDKTRSLHKRRTATWVGLIRKHYTRLESPIRDKHSSFLGLFIKYGEIYKEKMFRIRLLALSTIRRSLKMFFFMTIVG